MTNELAGENCPKCTKMNWVRIGRHDIDVLKCCWCGHLYASDPADHEELAGREEDTFKTPNDALAGKEGE